jgi:hypothetical protein
VIPLPMILAELVMGLGAALVAGNAYALFRPRRPMGRDDQEVRVQAKGKVVTSMFIGLLVFVWGLASFITERGN